MPELPEVETVRTVIASHVIGRRIIGFSLRDFPAVLVFPPAADAESLIVHQVISTARRRGKYLLLDLSNSLTLVIHLRMTGRLLILPSSAPAVRFEHLAIHLDSGEDLRFGDQRKFGRVVIALPEDVEALNRRLGPEPLDHSLTAERLIERLRRRTGPIKGALLDQSLIAGLGNIYVDEALFRSRIHPRRPANSLSADDTRRLLRAVRHVLNQAITHQGTTFSSFENPYGESGSNADFLRVYGKSRTGGRCPRCGRLLERSVVAGRGTSSCPKCQPLKPASLADDS